jgi:CRP-like cAMP-binding protein
MQRQQRMSFDDALSVQKQSYLSEVAIFQDLSLEDMAELARNAPMKQVDAGTIFHSPEDSAEVLFILKKGRVKVYQLTPDGRALTLHLFEAGAIFGEMSLLGQGMHGSFAQALTPCTLCLMSRDHVQRLLFGDPRIALRIAEALAGRLTHLENRLIDFAFRRMPERLARLLLQLAQPHRNFLQRVQRMEVRYTHEELADMIGATRETVTKLLNEMRARNLIELQRGRVTLLDMNGLQRIASGEPSGISLEHTLPDSSTHLIPPTG